MKRLAPFAICQRAWRTLFDLAVRGSRYPRDHNLLWALRDRRAGRHGMGTHAPKREDAPLLRNPIFMVGSMRSGSTYLARCLDGHPALAYVGYELTRQWERYGGLWFGDGRQTAHCPPLSRGDALHTRRTALRRGFADTASRDRRGSAQRMLNKNPHLWNKLPFLREVFPDASLVIVSRDIHSTVASLKAFWIRECRARGVRKYLPESWDYCWSTVPPALPEHMDRRRLFPGGAVSVLAEYWLRCYETIARDARLFDPVVELQHHAFVQQPEQIFGQISDALHLPPARVRLPDPLDRSRNQRWPALLDEREQDELKGFVYGHYDRIQSLPFADTSI